jgi:hypothetical protein
MVRKRQVSSLPEETKKVVLGRKNSSRREEPRVKEEKVTESFLTVITRPVVADLFIDGQFKGKTQPVKKIKISPGPHTICLSSRMIEEKFIQIEVKPGENKILKVTLDLLPAYLWVKGKAGTNIYIDDIYLGKLPFKESKEIPHGKHKIIGFFPDGRKWEKKINFIPGEKVEIEIK